MTTPYSWFIYGHHCEPEAVPVFEHREHGWPTINQTIQKAIFIWMKKIDEKAIDEKYVRKAVGKDQRRLREGCGTTRAFKRFCTRSARIGCFFEDGINLCGKSVGTYWYGSHIDQYGLSLVSIMKGITKDHNPLCAKLVHHFLPSHAWRHNSHARCAEGFSGACQSLPRHRVMVKCKNSRSESHRCHVPSRSVTLRVSISSVQKHDLCDSNSNGCPAAPRRSEHHDERR